MRTQHSRRNALPIAPIEIGSPIQIAYCSYFPLEANKHEYQSRDALKLYSPPDFEEDPSSRLLTNALKKEEWAKICDDLDSPPQPGSEVLRIIASCQKAGHEDDLREADVLTTRGTMVDLAVGKEQKYDVAFAEGKLHIVRKSFQFRTGLNDRIAYYGDCFEKLCARPITQKLHGTFFSIVRRKIGDLKVIMSGEVDCSSSTDQKPKMEDYIELKTFQKADRLYRRWYMQSYMLGVQVLQIGRRNPEGCVTISPKSIEELLQDARKYDPSFNPDVDMKRVHDILDALLKYLRARGLPVSVQDGFELRVDADGNAPITFPSESGGRQAVPLYEVESQNWRMRRRRA